METQFGITAKIIRSDRGGEYTGKNLKEFYKRKGIRMQLTAPHTPEQNGQAERKNRSLIEMTKCLLQEAVLPKKYWGEAINTANEILNRVPFKGTSRTSYEMWFCQKPNIAYFKRFGSRVVMHRPKEQRLKLDNTGERLIFIGYEDGSKAYRLLNVVTSKICISRNVYFIDKSLSSNESPIKEQPSEMKDTVEVDVPISSRQDSHNVNPADQSETMVQPARRISTRSTKGIPPSRYTEASYKTEDNLYEDPKTVQEALKRKDHTKWELAMIKEIEVMNRNHVWDIVESPKNQSIVGCKWVFKQKTDEHDNVIRYKARLVAQGYSQRYGHDYNEIFAPVLQQTTLRILLSVAGKRNWEVRHYDVESAFLNGDLDHDVYMQQPEFFKKAGDIRVCKLKKSIYGLKQGARFWYKKWKSILCNEDFKRSQYDHCLFSRHTQEGSIYVGVHVDDIATTTSNRIISTI